MKFYPSLFFKEALLFGGTLVLGIWVSVQYLAALSSEPLLQPSGISGVDIVGFVVLLAVVWWVSRKPKFATWIFWIFLVLIVFSGTQVVALTFLKPSYDILFAIGAVLAFLFVRSVIVHDLAIIAAVAGIGAIVGLQITPSLAILIFVILSLYDIIAVYKTRHMVKMAESMIHSGAIFGFIIPTKAKSFFAKRREAQVRVGRDFTILGSGDIGLPVIFVSSLVRQSLNEAIVAAIFAVLGLLMTHILFVSQENRQPMAALPPIATMTLIGYIISLLFKL